MTADQRNSHPNKSFMTNNFLIKKEILDQIKFDERITAYGHEDTLFGYCLMKKHIQIKHIENPVLHGSLENNSAFLKKTESGIINLSRMLKHLGNEPGFIESVKMLKFHERINAKGLLIIVRPVFYLICPLIRILLVSGTVSLTLFDIYKLGFFTLYSGKVDQLH
jgi:hypothetical protein